MIWTARYDYPAPPERVAHIFADQAFALAVALAAGAVSPQVEVSAEPSGEFTVTARTVNPATSLPAQFATLAPGGLEIRQAQVWEAPGPAGERAATLAGEITGALVRITAQIALTPTPQGSQLAVDGEITAALPLLGAALEKAAMPAALGYLAAQDQVLRRWIAQELPADPPERSTQQSTQQSTEGWDGCQHVDHEDQS
ncbi:MAG: DUF2505 domain-containing protein [Bifidobacteriaceae bacterium]|nr:DUF2505 domain-containing protein [Bifidobacteriaceae bacterium]